MSCPLPIEWLDWLEEGSDSDPLASHLVECASCRVLVAAIRAQPANLRREHWLERLDRSLGRTFEMAVPTEAVFGELWLTVAPEPATDRALVVVVDEGTTEEGHEWYEAAPVSTDTENALPVDLLLAAADSSLNVPLRVRFEDQAVLAREQLESRVAILSAGGKEILERALSGEVEESHWGVPLEAATDPRLSAFDPSSHVIQQLAALYRSRANAAVESETSFTAELRSARVRRGLTRSSLADALAASLGVAVRAAKVKRYYADLENGLLDPRRVSDRAFRALADIVGISQDRLMDLRGSWRPTSEDASPVFARTTGDAAVTDRTPASREEWDEVDEMFLGRRQP
jgi:transcriptional regulator with XRE-family HTH domain